MDRLEGEPLAGRVDLSVGQPERFRRALVARVLEVPEDDPTSVVVRHGAFRLGATITRRVRFVEGHDDFVELRGNFGEVDLAFEVQKFDVHDLLISSLASPPW